jgi:tetratricopeptide (TPR) repeat protein
MMVSNGMTRIRQWLLVSGLLAGLIAASIGALIATERMRPSKVRALELAYLPKGEYIKVAVLGYRQIASDLIWLKAVQYLGEINQTPEGWLWAYHVMDVVTDIDPKFVAVYQAGGTILGVWAQRAQESIMLLEKGVRHNPNEWTLPFFLGYDYFYELHDPVTAAKYFRMASALPGAPAYLPKLAARMTVEAGDPAAALEFLERLYTQTQDERLQEALVQRMKEVIIERDIRFLEEGVRQYRARYKRWPAGLEDLVHKGIITAIPPEPLGGAYVLGSPEGTVKSTALAGRMRVLRKH